MKFNIERVCVNALSEKKFEESLQRIKSIIFESSKIVGVMGINIRNEKQFIIEVADGDKLGEFVTMKTIENILRKVIEVSSDRRFDVDIVIPVSFSPISFDTWDNRKILSKTPDLCKKISDYVVNHVTIIADEV